MSSISAKVKEDITPGSPYWEVLVYAGSNPVTRQLCGTLKMHRDEADEMVRRISEGEQQ